MCESLEAGCTIFSPDFRERCGFPIAAVPISESDADEDIFCNLSCSSCDDKGVRGGYIDWPERHRFDVIILHPGHAAVSRAQSRYDQGGIEDAPPWAILSLALAVIVIWNESYHPTPFALLSQSA